DGSNAAGAGPSATAVPSVEVTATQPPNESAPPTVATVATTAPVQKVPLGRTLGDGVTGDDVRMVQTRLAELGFDPGPVDGVYGGVTIEAVWAFEKLLLGTSSAAATGRVTPEMWDRMQDPIAVTPRRPTAGGARHVEVYLPEQVMAIF